MMHSVPNCLTTSQSFETSCFAPPSPLESSPPSSPFDFDLDLLPDEIVSPANLDISLSTPFISANLQNENQEYIDNNNEDITNKPSSTSSDIPLNSNTFSPDCQVPNSPSSFSIDSGILSPTMFSPSSEEQGNKSSGNKLGDINSPGHQSQHQRSVPSASPSSMSPSSPLYSPAVRQQRRLSSTDSGKTSTSTASGKSFGGVNIFAGLDCNLEASLHEFAQLQQKIRLEQEGLESQRPHPTTGSEGTRSMSNNPQYSYPSNTQVSHVPISLGSLNPYPPDVLTQSEGGGKLPSALSLRSKLHTTIKSEPTLDQSSRKTILYSTKPTPLLRQVLEDKSFEQKFGVKPMDFVMEPSTLGSIEKALGGSHTEGNTAFEKQDVDVISNNPVISLAMDQVKKDIHTTCEILSISPGNDQYILYILQILLLQYSV